MRRAHPTAAAAASMSGQIELALAVDWSRTAGARARDPKRCLAAWLPGCSDAADEQLILITVICRCA